jgi:ribosomal protein S18 acetylase RimI-like enzyme
LLEQRDIGAFVSWRGGDPYIDGLLRLSIGEHSEKLRFILVALVGDEMVGTVALVRNHSDSDMADGERTGYVEALEVRDGRRRRGIASALLARLAGLAAQEGFSRLTVMVEPDNEPAVAFFNRIGFRFFKRSEFVWRGNARPVVCLERSSAALQAIRPKEDTGSVPSSGANSPT